MLMQYLGLNWTRMKKKIDKPLHFYESRVMMESDRLDSRKLRKLEMEKRAQAELEAKKAWDEQDFDLPF